MTRSVLVAFLAAFLLHTVHSVSVSKSAESDIVLKVSADKHSSRSGHHFSGEWLESPWGDLYQFRAGDQNWLTAREHCLSLNADLAAIRNTEQLDWILSHYAPLSSRFAQRLVQIGLYAPEGQTHEWKWLDGKEVNQTLQWSSGEPYDHSMEGRERCGLLNVEKRRLDDVDCESTSPDHLAQRYICQRTNENHKQQQRSNNYIWQKIENLFSFFGIGATPTAHNATLPPSKDYEDEVAKKDSSSTASSTSASLPVKFTDEEDETSSEEEESVVKTLAALPKIEGSGESTALKELQEPEGSGQIVEKKAIELAGGVDEKKLDKMIDKMEEMIKSIDDLTVPPTRTTVATPVIKEEDGVVEDTVVEKVEEKKTDGLEDNKISESIEGDFDQAQSKDMPKADIVPPKPEEEEDCDEEGSGSGGSGEEADDLEKEADEKLSQHLELAPEKEDKIKEFLGVLRLFLDRAEHGDLRKLLDDQSGKTLLERMKNAVREANKREFEMLEKLETAKKSGKEEELMKKLKGDQMSADEQKDLFKKISSAVMKAAKEEKKEPAQDAPGMEKFNIAQEKISKEVDEDDDAGTLEVLKSSNESKKEEAKEAETKETKEKKVGDDDYYGDYLDDNNVVKIQNREKKDVQKDEEGKAAVAEDVPKDVATTEKVEEVTSEAPKKEEDVKTSEKEEKEEKKEEDVTTTEAAKEEEATTSSEVKKEEEVTSEAPKQEDATTTTEKASEAPTTTEEEKVTEEAKKEEDVTTTTEDATTTTEEASTTATSEEPPKESIALKEKEPSTTSEEQEATTSLKPAEAEENEAELEASGQEDVTTTTESTTVAVKEVAEEDIEKLTKLEAKQTDDELTTEVVTTTVPTTTVAAATTTAAPKATTPAAPVTVSMRKVSKEEMEKLSKMEATEKVTLLPPLPTFTFPTLAPFTFPTLPTLPTTKPTPAPKVPTLEEILGNLNDQFKKLLAPPKPLAPK